MVHTCPSGLGHSRYTETRWLEKLADQPLLRRMPLVRNQNLLTIGDAEDEWKKWLAK